jgi:glycosyltransferase involved in cell wall biosynthesis
MGMVEALRLSRERAALSLKVVITMPAYNAEATLARTVADIPLGVADQLILVDDASPDNTAALARELGIDVYVHPENRGYGGNQKTCYATALADEADVVVMLHPDYQYEPKAVPLLLAPILAGDADMTFGSRFAGLADPLAGGMPLFRYVGNRVTTTLENLLLGSRFSEMHSGMRAYTRRCLLSLPFLRYRNDFVFDSELLIDAVTSGQRVVEVPIPTRYTEESSSIGILRSFSYVSGSLGYCARRVLTHGRRKHRSPIGRRAADPRGSYRPRGNTEASFLDAALAVLDDYFLEERRVALLGASPLPGRERLLRWEQVDSSSGGAGDRPANALVALGEESVDAHGGWTVVREQLAGEGLLALRAPTSVEGAQALARSLRGAGLQLVEIVSLGSRPRAAVAVARAS